MTIAAKIETAKGTIGLSLFDDETPVAVASFVNLAQQGFYGGLTFHRVIADFMIQGGCPDGNGRGGPGYEFEDEFNVRLRHDKAGRLALANTGPGTNGSQFFITHKRTPWLDDAHTIFGEVVEPADQKVVDRIAQGDMIASVDITGDATALLEAHADRVAEWNAALERRSSGRSRWRR